MILGRVLLFFINLRIYCAIKLRWHNEKHIIASLHLEDVRGLTIEKNNGGKSFYIFIEDSLVRD